MSEKVDLVVMISELEMARDIQIAETLSPAPDVILNSDMHERTTEPIVGEPRRSPTLIVEEGQDGTVVGQLELEVEKRQGHRMGLQRSMSSPTDHGRPDDRRQGGRGPRALRDRHLRARPDGDGGR